MKFLCPITSLKFVGTISLGLLTGISYTTSSIVLPSLAFLPSAATAKSTLNYIQTTATRQILTLASVSSISLLTAYSMASPRGKHPYLLWVALMSFLGGQGVEYYYNGLERFYLLGGGSLNNSSKSGKATTTDKGERGLRESGYVDVSSGESVDVNGEKVEIEMNQERRVHTVRSVVAGLGFLMGVVGIWGDGA